ncbi:hypothetical protein ACOKM3_07640 [Streptomyces sp. BH106]|uniref:hypothetical protein n=1 Tax=Streptomyces sp. BH106 TaxID=3410409 RepID=UPI003CEBA4B8
MEGLGPGLFDDRAADRGLLAGRGGRGRGGQQQDAVAEQVVHAGGRLAQDRFGRGEVALRVRRWMTFSAGATFPKLEDQMVTWLVGKDSPDRMDAAVHAFTELADPDQLDTGITTARDNRLTGHR